MECEDEGGVISSFGDYRDFSGKSIFSLAFLTSRDMISTHIAILSLSSSMSHTRIYTNTIAQIAAKGFTALISIFLIKILTEYLSMEGYGMYSKVYNYLSIFAVIADLGLYTITVREISQHRDDPDRVEMILGNTLTLRTILGVIIIILSTILALGLP